MEPTIDPFLIRTCEAIIDLITIIRVGVSPGRLRVGCSHHRRASHAPDREQDRSFESGVGCHGQACFGSWTSGGQVHSHSPPPPPPPPPPPRRICCCCRPWRAHGRAGAGTQGSRVGMGIGRKDSIGGDDGIDLVRQGRSCMLPITTAGSEGSSGPVGGEGHHHPQGGRRRRRRRRRRGRDGSWRGGGGREWGCRGV